MLHILFNVFIYILALYGAVYLIMGFIDSIKNKLTNESKGVKFILLVKNQENCIEGIVRSIFIENFFTNIIYQDSFTILDMGSNDDTLKILEKLKKDYQYLNILTFNEKEEIFKYFEDNNLNLISNSN